ncbi:hypothetical protein BST63_00815 [Bradyrhizobium canariense]|uniref:Uncharacterized protein n=1 Tax=Bradyrhizobium canariense TaxID=255045 RepID=A0ABX3XBC0_9BRAD|nr:hypothetical protein BSR47_00710 [Bradyrhizobium canariense]OSJ36380.1 hypothetical protein BST63_00815 [Bradyrhizobium canariense]
MRHEVPRREPNAEMVIEVLTLGQLLSRDDKDDQAARCVKVCNDIIEGGDRLLNGCNLLQLVVTDS